MPDSLDDLPTRKLTKPWPFLLSVAPVRKNGRPKLVRNLPPPGPKPKRLRKVRSPEFWEQVALC